MAIDIEITAFRKYRRNTLQAFFSIRLVELDLQIFDLTLHESNGTRWIGLPARPQLDRENKAITNVAGKVQYAAVLKFASRLASDQFQTAVLTALANDRRAA